MIDLDDPKWKKLKGGYGELYDPTPALRRLEAGEDVWSELWNELHHQGDVGEASYAAVPQLLRIAKALPERDWNLYALAATIEVERHRKSNPPVPGWLKEDYDSAWRELRDIGVSDLLETEDPETVQSILGVLALAAGNIKLGALVAHLDSSELDEILEQQQAWSELYES